MLSETLIQRVNQRLDGLIPDSSSPLYAAARYSLLSQGKRLRPALVLAMAATFGGDLAKALDPACAIEMVHTYSLIHDDLPCMDDDDLRRGRPTLHKVFPEGIALLAGDYLLTYSFEVIGSAPKLTSEQRLRLSQILAFAAGSQGMVGGQAADICSAGGKIEEAALLEMHRGKTGALLAASLQFGAVAAEAPETILPLITSLGFEIGLAFQFLDDLLDATASKEVLGKNSQRDAALQKPTAVALYGIKGVEEKLGRFEDRVHERLLELPGGAPLIAGLLHHNLWARRPCAPSDRSASK
jgi:geranylgeranyl diphosphate synthase, type II